MSYAAFGLPADVDPNKWYVDEQTFWVDEDANGVLYKGFTAHPEPTLPDSPTITQWCRATPGPHFTRGPFEYGDYETGAIIRSIDLHSGALPPEIMAAKDQQKLPAFEPYRCKTPMSTMQMSLIAAAGLVTIAAAVHLARRPR